MWYLFCDVEFAFSAVFGQGTSHLAAVTWILCSRVDITVLRTADTLSSQMQMCAFAETVPTTKSVGYGILNVPPKGNSH
jgi:hypothetical protein